MNCNAWLENWWASASLWEMVKFWIPTTISIVAISIVIKDRWPSLSLKERLGEWCILKSSDRGVIFEGIVEVCNVSNRANCIRGYRFWKKDPDGSWTELESEHYTNVEEDNAVAIFNLTPLVLPPFSGTEVRVQALTKLSPRPHEMIVKIEVEDLFGKGYSVELTARS